MTAQEKRNRSGKKFLTIMFVDIIKSTQLFEEYDSEDLAEILDNFIKKSKDIVGASYGFVNQTLGDGFYAVFGFDDSASHKQAFWACWAAQRLRNETKEFKLRIAIDSGYATYTENSSFHDLNYHLVGAVINDCAHLCNKADNQKISISENVYKQVQDNFFISADKAEDKDNKASYTLNGIANYINKFLNYSVFLVPSFAGRQKELEKCIDITETAFRETAQSIHLHGGSGIGKTSFICQVLKSLHQKHKDLSILSYSWFPEECQNLSIIDAFFDQVIRDFSLFDLDQDQISKFFLNHKLKRRTFLPMLSEYLGFKQKHYSDWNDLNNKQKQYIKADFVTDLVCILSQKEKIIVIFDDIQWSDSAADILLKSFYSKIGKGNFSLISSSRKSAEDHEFQPKKSIHLKPIQKRDIEKIILSLTKFSCVSKEVLQRILDLSSANPYYVSQIAAYLDRTFSNLDEIEAHHDLVPNTIDSVFAEKLQRLPKNHQEVVKTSSIIGQTFTYEDLQSLIDKKAINLEAALTSLEKEKIIKRVSIFDDIYEFTHALERKVVYKSLSKKYRIRKHSEHLKRLEQKKSDHLDNPYIRLAYQAYGANLYGKAYAYGRCAGKRNLDLSMPEQAIDFYKISLRAAEELEKNAKNNFRLCRAHIGLAKAYCLNGNGKKAKISLMAARELMKYVVTLFHTQLNKECLDAETAIRWILCEYDYNIINNIDAPAEQKQQLELATSIRVAGMLQDLGYFEESNRRLLKLVDSYSLNNNEGLLFPSHSMCLGPISRNYGELGHHTLAAQYADMALNLIDDIKFSPQKIFSLTFSASYLIRGKEFEKAHTLLEEAYILTNQFRVGMIKPFVFAQYAYTKFHIDRDYDSACSMLENLFSLMHSKGYYARYTLFKFFLASIHAKAGKFEDCVLVAQEAIKSSERFNDLWIKPYLYLLLYRVSRENPHKLFLTTKEEKKFFLDAISIAKKLELAPILKEAENLRLEFVTTA